MSDAVEAVREAMARNRQLAARHLVRKEEIEADLARWRAERAQLTATAEGEALLPELDARIEAASADLAAVEREYRSALAELAELEKLARGAAHADARAGAMIASVEGDPLVRSAEEVALDNVRGHLAELEAQARVGEETAAQARTQAPPSREEAEAQARAEFEELRAKRERGGETPPKKTI